METPGDRGEAERPSPSQDGAPRAGEDRRDSDLLRLSLEPLATTEDQQHDGANHAGDPQTHARRRQLLG